MGLLVENRAKWTWTLEFQELPGGDDTTGGSDQPIRPVGGARNTPSWHEDCGEPPGETVSEDKNKQQKRTGKPQCDTCNRRSYTAVNSASFFGFCFFFFATLHQSAYKFATWLRCHF